MNTNFQSNIPNGNINNNNISSEIIEMELPETLIIPWENHNPFNYKFGSIWLFKKMETNQHIGIGLNKRRKIKVTVL